MGDNRVRPVAVRFWEKVAKTDTCWLWTGSLTAKGYGYLCVAKKNVRAHRISLNLAGREIPSDLVVDHLCRVPRCVRPDHLELVPSRINTIRGVSPAAQNAAKTTCKRGHELVHRPGVKMVRRCPKCWNHARDERRRLARLGGGK